MTARSDIPGTASERLDSIKARRGWLPSLFSLYTDSASSASVDAPPEPAKLLLGGFNLKRGGSPARPPPPLDQSLLDLPSFTMAITSPMAAIVTCVASNAVNQMHLL